MPVQNDNAEGQKVSKQDGGLIDQYYVGSQKISGLKAIS